MWTSETHCIFCVPKIVNIDLYLLKTFENGFLNDSVVTAGTLVDELCPSNNTPDFTMSATDTDTHFLHVFYKCIPPCPMWPAPSLLPSRFNLFLYSLVLGCCRWSTAFPCVPVHFNHWHYMHTAFNQTTLSIYSRNNVGMFTLPPRPDLTDRRPGDQLKFGLTKTMINNARQLSRSLCRLD